jgi:carboxylesterase type B
LTVGTSDPDTGIDSFLGIRYAAPPIGELRFQYPQFPLLERDIVQADRLPHKCPQANHSNPYLSNEYDGDEDCLFLNIYKPTAIEEGQSLPVMVYIRMVCLCKTEM